jgi:hypothetical protein
MSADLALLRAGDRIEQQQAVAHRVGDDQAPAVGRRIQVVRFLAGVDPLDFPSIAHVQQADGGIPRVEDEGQTACAGPERPRPGRAARRRCRGYAGRGSGAGLSARRGARGQGQSRSRKRDLSSSNPHGHQGYPPSGMPPRCVGVARDRSFFYNPSSSPETERTPP